ncbi:major facilitator superfamily domain-containing protein [Naematelia encephala]|uniref:Major facilitator superfamily domain-containing protein n=1 Tax=Naematelia encephala TaxID=71784 RepID=A0A1Y2AWQ5_9TREE|nr:major facilitator superfamily domain-containing protein [Naematelia encephala]
MASHLQLSVDGVAQKVTWKGRIWDTFDLPPDERKLLFKLDAVLLTFMSLGYFVKNLDQSNVTNAWASGMEVDLEMYGNQLVTASTIWTVGYIIGQIPTNLILTRISPRYVIPFLELAWGIVTLGTYSVKSYRALYAVRFLVGLLESGFYPSAHMILGSWYTPRELGKRAVIFWVTGTIGGMFSGFLQAAAYRNLSGVHGLAGWRWLFVIDAILTIPVTLIGFFFLPDLPPDGKRVWWLKPEEYELAKARVSNVGKAGRTPWSWAKIKRYGSTWHIYVLPMVFGFWGISGPQNPLLYYLKSFNKTPAPVPGRHFTIEQINNYPTVGSALLVVTALIGGWISDGPLRGRRYPIIYFGAFVTLLLAILARQLPLYQNVNGHIALYWLMNVGICAGDFEKRALLVAMGNDSTYVLSAIYQNFIWKTTDFPAAKKGLLWSILWSVVFILWITLTLFLLRRDEKRGYVHGADTEKETYENRAASPGQVDADIDSKDEIGA